MIDENNSLYEYGLNALYREFLENKGETPAYNEFLAKREKLVTSDAPTLDELRQMKTLTDGIRLSMKTAPPLMTLKR